MLSAKMGEKKNYCTMNELQFILYQLTEEEGKKGKKKTFAKIT